MSQQSGNRGNKSVVIVVLAMAIIASLVATVPAFATNINDQTAAQTARPLGVVPVRGAQPSIPAAVIPLVYHRGPVMLTNKVYAIYWIPAGFTVSANYQSLINGFFSNVAADSGKTSNVYFSDTQYYQITGRTKTFISYNSAFGGSVVDTHALPASGCTDTATPGVCLTDAQLQAEIQSVAAAQGWAANATTEFYMFTAKGIGSCFDSTGASCAFTQYCAYHSWIGSGTTASLYANMPYADTVASACDVGQHPNNDDADATINVTSHEHNETITDAQGTAWWDRTGAENGDKCAWNFGTALGNTGFGLYNQAIGTGKYYLQQEWSNFSRGCVLTNK